MRLLSKVRVVLSCSVLFAAVTVAAQAGTPNAAADTDYPEHAYLSPSHYVNQYFGFSFELPEEAHLHAVPEPAARNGSVPLLNLAGPPPADAQILIAAFPVASGNNEDARLLLRQALDRELYIGVEELRGLSKASFSGHQFYLYETHRGIEQHMMLATTMGDYIVRVVLAGHDETMVKKLEAAFEHLVFFAPATVRSHVQPDAKPYDGPSISSRRLALLESDPPAKHIDPGRINGDFYENAMLGFSYRIPQGWALESQGAVQPAVERSRSKEDLGRPQMGRAERVLVDTCTRTLFSTWAKRPGADGHLSYDGFSEVTVSAMSLACFPQMKFPSDAHDSDGFKRFVADYVLTHPIVNDMLEGKTFTQDGLTFLFLQGTVAFQVPGDELSRRLSLGMAITQRRGYLLTWFFAAPHGEELRALTNERASFDRGTDVTAANAPQPGGGVAAETVPSAPAPEAPKPAAAAEASATGGSSAAPAATNPGTQPASTTNASDATTTPFHPSLLRPGETIESQQGKGPLIKKKK